MTTLNRAGAALLWIVLLAAAGTLTSTALACATPFVALAALAAVHLERADGLALMGLVWLADQVIGFGLHHYPVTATSLGWGAALAVAAPAAALASYATVVALGDGAGRPLRLALAFLAAFVGFKAVVLGCALGLGDLAMLAKPGLIARQLVREGAVLVGLLALYRLLVAVGVPAARRTPALA